MAAAAEKAEGRVTEPPKPQRAPEPHAQRVRVPSIGVHIIARNEEELLPRLLDSIDLHFDQVVLCDTGSTDQTVEVFRAWGKAKQAERAKRIKAHELPDHAIPFYKVTKYEGDDGGPLSDFSAARRHADTLLDTDWNSWADCDDVIVGADRLRLVAANAPPQIVGFVFGYNYAQDPKGNSISYLKRERLVRRGAGTWQNRVHEAQTMLGDAVYVEPDVAEWVHLKPMSEAEIESGRSDSNERNLAILKKWVEDEPENARVVAYMGTETAISGDHREALRWYHRYLDLNPGWDEERAQIHRKAAMSLMALDRFEEARQTSLQALAVLPSWPDSHLTMAECELALGAPAKALWWADRVLEIGPPETLLILNHLDYTFMPMLVKAGALADLGALDDAVEWGRRALDLHPFHEELRYRWGRWREAVKVEHTAGTWATAIELLVNHDENLKARAMLDTVPYFAEHHPKVVGLRTFLTRRFEAIRYDDESPKPEHWIEDVPGTCAILSRAIFLRRGLREQQGLEPEPETVAA